MHLRHKIGQMLIVGFEGTKVDQNSEIIQNIEADHLGGVILFDYNPYTHTYKNIENPEQVKKLNHDLQHFTHQSNLTNSRPELPLLISIDYEGGEVTRLKEEYGFPKTFSAQYVAEQNIQNAEKIAETMALTLKQLGFNLNFSPVVDVNINPNNPIIGKKNRSFSADPKEVAIYAAIYCKQFLKHHIQCSYKHFPGHGSSNEDSHLGFVDVTKTWHPNELEPYQILLNQDISSGVVMTAHVINKQLDPSGLPATLSYRILTEILRNEFHFKGVIMTDDMQMKAISDHYGLDEALELAILAGADMFIFGNNLSSSTQNIKEVINIIEEKVKSGVISENRINESYQRVLSLKKSIC